MFDYIKGSLSYKISNSKGAFITVDVAGIGYLLEILQRDYDSCADINSEIKVYTVLIHKEDKMSLCGFIRREDRDIFNVLTSVSGVGTKMALTLLNYFDVPNLIGFVIGGDYKSLTRAKGVGPKLAQKIILELKDKLSEYKNYVEDGSTVGNSKFISQNEEDAKMVLTSLGYEKSEIEKAISLSLQKIPENSSAEDILRACLQYLSV